MSQRTFYTHIISESLKKTSFSLPGRLIKRGTLVSVSGGLHLTKMRANASLVVCRPPLTSQPFPQVRNQKQTLDYDPKWTRIQFARIINYQQVRSGVILM